MMVKNKRRNQSAVKIRVGIIVLFLIGFIVVIRVVLEIIGFVVLEGGTIAGAVVTITGTLLIAGEEGIIDSEVGVDGADGFNGGGNGIGTGIADGEVKDIAVVFGAIAEAVIHAHTVAFEIRKDLFADVTDKHVGIPPLKLSKDHCGGGQENGGGERGRMNVADTS